MQDYAQSTASIETKTTTSSVASKLPRWREFQAGAVVDSSDWEHGSGTSAWSSMPEGLLWYAILAEVSDDLELHAGGPVDGDNWELAHEPSGWDAPEVFVALIADSSYSAWSKPSNFGKNSFGVNMASLNKPPFNIEPAKSKDAEPKSTAAGSSRSKSDISGFGKNAFGSTKNFWNEAVDTKLFQTQNVKPEPTGDFGSNKDFWKETSESELTQSEDSESEQPIARAPLIAAFIVPGSKAFKVLQELGTDEFKLFESVNTSYQKKHAHAIEQEQWS